MLRLLVRYGLQVAAIMAPLLAPTSWAAWIAKPLHLSDDAKTSADIVRGMASLLVLLGTSAIDAVDLYIPRQQAKEFGKAYANRMVEDLKKSGAPALGDHLRLNVMVVRFIVFEWRAKYGFNGSHLDTHIMLHRWQGLCGEALRNRDHRFIDLRVASFTSPRSWWCFSNPFRLTRGQLKKTQHVKAILSVPMFRTLGPSDNPRFKPVGVLNLDAVSDTGAAWLGDNRDLMAQFLSDHAKMLAYIA